MNFQEYFLGLDTHKLYKKARSKSKSEEKSRLYVLEFLDLSASKFLPNLTSFTGLTFSLLTGYFFPAVLGVFLGEGMRYCASKTYSNLRKSIGIEKTSLEDRLRWKKSNSLKSKLNTYEDDLTKKSEEDKYSIEGLEFLENYGEITNNFFDNSTETLEKENNKKDNDKTVSGYDGWLSPEDQYKDP